MDCTNRPINNDFVLNKPQYKSAQILFRPDAPLVSAGGNAVVRPLRYADLQPVLAQRCYLCHGEKVQMKNVRLDSPQYVKAYAQYLYQQAVVLKLMPMNNATGITEAERLLIKQWFESGARTD